MAKESETEGPGAATSARPGGAAAAWSLLGAASRKQVDAFLKEQTRLAQLQSQNLVEQNAYEVSHLRWRRLDDQMKGALQIMGAALAAAVVVGLAAAMWNASRAGGLVVESFSVPPAFAAAGMTGDVVAADLTNTVGVIRDFAVSNSIASSDDVRQEGASDIKVEILQTGVSLAQVWRYMRNWLGHERRLSGNLRDLGGGMIGLTLALDGERGFTLTGPAADLPILEEKAAERIFEAFDPNNLVVYLCTKGRVAECLAAAERFANKPGPAAERAAGMSLWGGMIRSATGDLKLAMTRERAAVAIAPKLQGPHWEMMLTTIAMGNDEEALRHARLIPKFRPKDQPRWLQGGTFERFVLTAEVVGDPLVGNFTEATPYPCPPCSAGFRAEMAARRHDVAGGRARLNDPAAATGFDPRDLIRGRYFLAAAAGDWAGAIAPARAYLVASTSASVPEGEGLNIPAMPLLAVALARSGDLDGAEAAIATSSLDCYHCLIARGQVAALQGKLAEADAWFGRAVAAGPSLPFGYTERGGLQLRKGDPAAAIAQFDLAHQKSPRFADALELWGEALMTQNHPDQALAKFEEAARYAPNWARLHLKWGEALLSLGRRDQAREHFAKAAKLSPMPDEAAELARVAPKAV